MRATWLLICVLCGLYLGMGCAAWVILDHMPVS